MVTGPRIRPLSSQLSAIQEVIRTGSKYTTLHSDYSRFPINKISTNRARSPRFTSQLCRLTSDEPTVVGVGEHSGSPNLANAQPLQLSLFISISSVSLPGHRHLVDRRA